MGQVTIPVRGARRELPQSIRRVLGRLGARLRLASLARGLGTTAFVAAIGAALGMAADFAWTLPQPVRWTIWAAWLAAGGLVFALTVLRPILRRLRIFDLAAAAETGHSELGEELTGAVALLGTGAPHGSPDLIAALADRAARSCRMLRPTGGVSLSRAVQRLVLGLGAVALLAAPPLLRPNPFGVLARRFLMPWAKVGRVARVVISVEPGDHVVAAGSDVTFTALARLRFGIGLGPPPDAAWLEWDDESGAGIQRLAMSPVAGDDSTRVTASSVRRFSLTMPRLARSIAYRVTSGATASRRHRITALEPPDVASISARIEPPAYTRWPVTMSRDPNRIEAFEGSLITLDIRPSRAVRSMRVEWPAEAEKAHALSPAVLADGGRKGLFSAVATASGPYHLAMRDEHGIGSRVDESRRVVVRPDAPPTLIVRGQGELKDVNPADTLTMAWAASDDVAVASLELHYAIRRGASIASEPESGHRDIKATRMGTSAARGLAALPLGTLALKPGDVISYRLRAADNRPAPKGPNVTWSPTNELTIVAGAQPMATRLARLRRSVIRAALDALRKDVAASREDAERLRAAADSARRGDAHWDAGRRRAVGEREQTLRDLIERLKQLARSLGENPATRPLARPARQIAELEAESSRAMLERARNEGDSGRRVEDLRQAGHRLATVSERLDELQRKIDAQDQTSARRGKLHELADRQQGLADAVATAGNRAEFDRLQARQNTVRNELDHLVREAPDLRGALLEAEAREAERLARAARDLSGRQRNETRRASDPSQHAAKLRALADAQRALEDDARRLALDVDPPLSENGRSRLNVEEIRLAAEPIERGDTDQARQRLEGAENELRKLAREIEDLPADPKALAWRLVRRQDALNGEINEALPRLREKDKLNKDEKDALDERLKALGRRQDAIAGLAASIKPPAGPQSRSRFPEHAAREAAEKTRRAVAAFAQPVARVIDERKNESRQALDRLANELPDSWRRSEPTRQKFDEARRITNELFNQVAQHLRETEPRPDRPLTTARAAEELARRLGDAPDRLAVAIKGLKEMEPEPRVEPQRARAIHGAEVMERVLRDLRDATKRETARAALPAADVQAHAAMDRLEQKLNGRTPADDLAAELAADQHAALADLARARGDHISAARAKATEAERRLASALRDLHAPDATLDQSEAVRASERAARALAEPKAGTDALAAATAATLRLAARLAGPPSSRQRAAALAGAERALNEPEAVADPAGSATRQRTIAAELALLPVENKAEAIGRVAYAAELADRAEQIDEDNAGPTRPTAAALADARTRAAEALDALAARPAKEEPKPADARPTMTIAADPELPLKPSHLASATELVRRQRQLRERFLAVLGRHVEPQEAIRRQSVALGQELIQLRDRIRPISDRGVYPAFEAAHHLRAYAAQNMDQAAEHLAKGQVPYAREAQRRASENVERGAQHAEDLAAALRAERLALAAPAPPAGAQPPFGAARAAIAHAARQLDRARDPTQAAHASPAARQAMREAARDLMAAALAAETDADVSALADFGEDDAVPADRAAQAPVGLATDPRTQPGHIAETDPGELETAIRRGTRRTWGELPGHLRTEILQAARGRYRDEYARLIQLYFREIATGAAERPAESPAPPASR